MKTFARFTVFSFTFVGMLIVTKAASPHYKPRLAVTCQPASSGVSALVFSGSCSAGTASGLGNEDLTFGVVATVEVGTFCHNPGNSNVVPGQNPANAQFAALQTIPGNTLKNGTFQFPETPFAFAVTAPSAEQAGCPNSNWTVTLGEAEWSASFVVYQPFPNLVESLSFSF